MCCDCCLLGRAAREQGLTCDHSLSLGYQCGLVSRACCDDRAPDVETKISQGKRINSKTREGLMVEGEEKVERLREKRWRSQASGAV